MYYVKFGTVAGQSRHRSNSLFDRIGENNFAPTVKPAFRRGGFIALPVKVVAGSATWQT
jgi:hypothetical protein